MRNSPLHSRLVKTTADVVKGVGKFLSYVDKAIDLAKTLEGFIHDRDLCLCMAWSNGYPKPGTGSGPWPTV